MSNVTVVNQDAKRPSIKRKLSVKKIGSGLGIEESNDYTSKKRDTRVEISNIEAMFGSISVPNSSTNNLKSSSQDNSLIVLKNPN